MKTRNVTSIAVVVVMSGLFGAAAPVDALAQIRRDRIWIAVNAGVQGPSEGLSDRFAFERHVETATVDVDYGAEPGIFFDAGGGFRFHGNLGAGVAVSRQTHDFGADIDASIPHPFFDNRHRAVAGTFDRATRLETGVHVQLTYTIRSRTGALQVMLSGGPSYLRVEQDVVTDVVYNDAFPFDEATFTTATTARARESAAGFHAGVDAAWMTGRRKQIGLGGMIRFSRASIDFDTPASAHDPRTISTTAGGVHAGAGLRLQF